MKQRLFQGLAALALFVFAASCDNQSMGIIGPNDPAQLRIEGIATKDANRGLPTTVRIYALSSDHLFYGYDYFSLTLEDEEVLGVTLKGVLDEIYIEPGKTVSYGPYDLPRNTRMIGVVGTFKDIGRAQWRDTVPVQDRGVAEKVHIIVNRGSISVVTDKRYKELKEAAEAKAIEQAQAKAEAQRKAQEAKAQQQKKAKAK